MYPGHAAWHFITLPADVSEEIRMTTEDSMRRGFGSVRVRVQIGESIWNTSIFPDKKSRSYFLPVKKEVRVSESITSGDKVDVRISIDI